MRSLYDRVLQGLGTIRGVKAAGLSSSRGSAERLSIEGQPQPRPGEPHPEISAINGHYLEAMRIPLLQGRSISDADRPGSPPVVVISENVARHFWPNANPVGRHIRLNAQSDWLTVVGVSGNVIPDWFRDRPSAAAYISFAQFPSSRTRLFLRTQGDPMLAAQPARFAIRTVDKDLPIYEFNTMEQMMYEERGGVRAAAQTMTTYAIIALLLAVTGLVFGIPLAILLARVMSSALYNVVKIDAITFAAFSGVLFLSALLASYLPTLRATRIDPMTALRDE